MVFWLVAAVLTAGVILWITRPLYGAPDVAMSDDLANVAVYRHQLEEIDADLARGVLNEADAEAARIEISRRLLQAADGADDLIPDTGADTRQQWGWREPGKLAAIACSVVVPLTGLGIYLSVGTPWLADNPRHVRLAIPASELPISEMIARVEARLRENPEDVRGWDVIGPIYLRQDRLADARAAFERGIAVGGETPERLAGLAQAMVRMTAGRVTDDILAINKKIVAMVPFAAESEFWIALGLEQRGQLAQARAAFAALIKPETIGQPWRPAVEARLAVLDQRLSGAASKPSPASTSAQPATAAAPGPKREDVEAAARMSPEARLEMIRGMVSGLAARLEENGDDIAGWQRLIRAQVVMGEQSKARDALRKARAQFAADPAALGSLQELAASLDLKSGTEGAKQ